MVIRIDGRVTTDNCVVTDGNASQAIQVSAPPNVNIRSKKQLLRRHDVNDTFEVKMLSTIDFGHEAATVEP